jgi:hypothetical protein
VSVVTPIDQPEPDRRERLNRWLFRIALLVLAAGTVVFLYAVLHDSTPKGPLPAVTFNDGKARTPAVIEPAARTVAGKFILTAVARKNVASSWPLVHPSLKQGYTKAEWAKGDIPVDFFPVGKIEQVRFRINEKTANGVVLEVALIPNPGVKMDPQTFYLGLRKTGRGDGARWLVDYWMSAWAPKIPKAPS